MGLPAVIRWSRSDVVARARPKLSHRLIFRQVEEDFVAYDPMTDRTALLNSSAAAILDLCDGSRSPGEIVDEVAAAFSVDRESIAPEVDRILGFLAVHGLLEPEEGTPA